jgi:serine/threonine protein phosphatase PrpC
MALQLEHAAVTDVGRVRQQNEDAWLSIPETGLFAVADGMGGHAAGEVASQLAVETIAEELGASAPATADAARSELERAVVAAARRIHDQASRSPERRGMGTTVTALWLLPAGRAALAHVGDSRAYRFRGGTLQRLTHDHTWVQEQVDRGILTREDARVHPASAMLTRALGTDPGVEPDLLEFDWRPGDLFLLCSDGLTGPVDDEEIEEKLRASGDPEEAATSLVALANRRGGPDNVTVLLARTPQA